MNLVEFQAKKFLSQSGVPVPPSWLSKNAKHTPHGVEFPAVAKSQVPVGGRGKAGGIVRVNGENELKNALKKLYELEIKGHTPDVILIEKAVDIERELYLAIRLNRDQKAIEIMASPHGGMDVESAPTPPEVFLATDARVEEKVANVLSISCDTFRPLLSNLIKKFISRDLLLLEINPLVVTKDGELVCADAKITVDNNAQFRQPNFPWSEITGNPPKFLGGTIGCIANGAGMAMSTMDTIVAMGGKPANFLDIGGGTGEKEFVTALKQIGELPGVSSIIVNIFAGISRCDEIARGLIAAKRQLHNLPPLFVRLEGTNRDIAVTLLEPTDIDIEPDLRTCVQKAMEIEK